MVQRKSLISSIVLKAIWFLSACDSAKPTLQTSIPEPLTAIPTYTSLPKDTSTPTVTITPQSESSPAEFPIPILSKQQIQEVADCNFKELSNERYPENIKTADLLNSFTPSSGCDWAVLSIGYAARNENGTLSQPGLEAFKKAVSNNYGFALAPFLFDYYFGSVSLVKTPQFANQEIVKVVITYTWSGLGTPSQVAHSLNINNANTTPIISSSTDTISNTTALDKATIQDLAKGLVDLLPIDSEIQLAYCTDNYPEWLVSLTFTDDTSIDMKSNSNFLFVGGPWLTEIDGQTYIQYSQAFAEKIAGLFKELGLPLGEPAGMYCYGGSVFENAFSRFLPPTSTPSPNYTAEAIYTAVVQTVNAKLTQLAAGTLTPKP